MKKIITTFTIICALGLIMIGCREEKTPEEKIEAAMEEVNEDLENAADDVKDAAEDLQDEIEEVAEEAGDDNN
ncbi:hypothetical protein [Psychroserpens mesophilus]|jgi:gas vesicle protein|uniref:hypothetical protein n=1 Tax=Psychroserpens mesophilus TaxID=325473 RepID=UPI003F491702